ncbi:acyl-CoA--sterol O-acyltransferase 1-like [Punica granatum]|uniref:Wax synthase domain-containing protein n=2 Tax=Punica granatum TaxID=22663 RepID=A0A218XDQ4_PUNGR|nr:acyl-CoA--sterol O-acyltransferase 1-like [Punica granatum]OWM83345.1 hypothetical protein CDL15_Pgr012826 [Punica granatum]PKI66400.1 hypothetical protein CRG98_013202 [Punica granatum]
MEGELNNFILVWISAAASLCYCHTASKLVPAGLTRLLCLAPVVCLFLALPLRLTTLSLSSLSSFFLSWLANFKLLLLAFGEGPLCSNPPLTLPRFLAIAGLPIKLQTLPHPNEENVAKKEGLKSLLNYAARCLLLASFVPLYEKEWIHQKLIMMMYAIHVYVSLEVSLAIVGAAAWAFTGIGLEPQFDEPYLSTSLQDFWGRRWNLMVTSILHPSVYKPMRSISARWFERRWTAVPAAFSAFLVSGLMHELVFYHIGRRDPTWAVTTFFLLHGVSVAVEIGLKKSIRWRLPKVVSCPLTVAYVVATGLWLFIPALMECDAVPKARRETVALIEFVKHCWSILQFCSITIWSIFKT